MKRFRLLLTGVVFTLVLFVAVPAGAHAASASFFGPIISPECTCPGTAGAPEAPGFGCALQTIQNLMNVAVSLSVIIMVLVIAYAGILLIFNPTNPEYKSKAKTILTNAVVGMVIVLAGWLVIDFAMKILYDPTAVFSGQTIGPWNEILSGGTPCIVVDKNIQSIFNGPSVFTAPGTGAGSSAVGGPINATGQGACNASAIASAAAGSGVRMSSQEANTLACVAGPESACGTQMQNYNWNGAKSQPPSTAYGPFQITLKGNSDCFEDPACYQVAGVSGPLNCNEAFTSSGNAIPGPQLQACQRAAANLACSAVAADCVSKGGTTFSPWTADKSSSKQQACISGNGG